MQAVLFLFLQTKIMENSIERASQVAENKTYQGKEVRLCNDGKYRWVYEMNLLKNPTIFITVLKVMMISVGIVWLFGLVIGLGNMSCIMLGIFVVLTIIGVLITAAILGKYVVLFEMDEKEVTHIQMPRQVKKAEVIGLITALVGAMAKSPTTMGAGMLAASKTKSTSVFANVRRVKARRRFNLIKVNQLLDKNQVYVPDEDFDFVYDFIKSHCTKAK